MYSNLKKDYSHNRKRKATDKPNKAEKLHMDRIGRFGCLVCGNSANIHHVMHMKGKRCRRDHRFIAPLCRSHHQEKGGVHDLGGEEQFKKVYGIDLVKWAKDQWSSFKE